MVKHWDSLKRPFSDWKKLGIGFLVSIVPIVNLMMTGYGLKCAQSAAKKKIKGLPEWEKFWELFVKGLVVMIIGLIYVLPALLLFLIGAFNGISQLGGFDTLLDALDGGDDAITLYYGSLLLMAWPWFLAGFILLLFLLYLTPMATMNYAMKGKFRAAFDFRQVLRKTFTSKLFLAVLFMIGVFFLIAIPLVIIELIFKLTPFGGIVSLLSDATITAITTIISMSLYGQVYAETK